jgi:hypothetical protein
MGTFEQFAARSVVEATLFCELHILRRRRLGSLEKSDFLIEKNK